LAAGFLVFRRAMLAVGDTGLWGDSGLARGLVRSSAPGFLVFLRAMLAVCDTGLWGDSRGVVLAVGVHWFKYCLKCFA
jgi:hypothetical protein